MRKVVFQLKATIRDTEPPVWRRLVVPGEITLSGLHDVLQAAFGWSDHHLHEFDIAGVRFGVDDGEDDEPPEDEGRAKLRDVADVGSTFMYAYDFGDNWQHSITVEQVVTELCQAHRRSVSRAVARARRRIAAA
jgi:hypothetical protein